jgi:hypothetical protein
MVVNMVRIGAPVSASEAIMFPAMAIIDTLFMSLLLRSLTAAPPS